MRTFLRIFAQSWQQLVRNAWIWTATLVVFLLAFLSINVLLGTNVLTDRVLNEARQRVDVSISFKAGTPPTIVDQAKTYLLGLPSVEKVDLVSADVALEAFRARYQYQEDVQKALQEVGRNPLGAKLTVHAKTLTDYPAIIQAMQVPVYQPWIQGGSSTDHASAIQELETLRRAIRLAGSLLLLLFICVAILLAFNAVRTAIFSQREEIHVMRLVGATQARIRLPYLLSVLWIVTIALGMVIGVGIAGYYWLLPQSSGWLQESLYALRDAAVSRGTTVLFAQFGIATVLSMMVAWIATGKYIKR